MQKNIFDCFAFGKKHGNFFINFFKNAFNAIDFFVIICYLFVTLKTNDILLIFTANTALCYILYSNSESCEYFVILKGYILDKIQCILFLLCTQFGIITTVYWNTYYYFKN